jgi:hypothetical protein
MVPAPVFFFAQDDFNRNISNLDLDSYPYSFAKRNDFLDYFNQTTSSPQQSFENFPTGVLTVSVPLSTIGNVTFSGNNTLRIEQDSGGYDFSTEGIQSLFVPASTAVNIFFPVVVVGVGFTIYDLDRAIRLQFMLNGTDVGSFRIPGSPSIGIVFIGYIDYNGFNTMLITPTSIGDNYYIDQFTAYKASELL